jgi:hypothetical protein
MTMWLANETKIAQITNSAIYGEAATVNAAVVTKTNGKVPCYAIKGKRSFKWFSVGSSAGIGRAVAAEWLARYGADINEVEAA